MKIISIANQKGGVGKTNTAINLAAALTKYNRKVLLIDLDPQGNTSRGYGIDTSLVENSSMDLLFKKISINSALKLTCVENLYIIPSKLSVTFEESYDNYDLLKNSLKKLNNDFDYVIIDCPPSLGFLTMNAFAASDSVLIPVQCQYFALNAVTQILALISKVQKGLNPQLGVEGVLLTMYDPYSETDNEIATEIRNIFKENTYVTKIPRTNSIPESNIRGIPVLMWRPSGKASSAYLSLAKEIIDVEGRN